MDDSSSEFSPKDNLGVALSTPPELLGETTPELLGETPPELLVEASRPSDDIWDSEFFGSK